MATTKNKKVQTHIDERETFVSLQKSFAEGGQSIQEKLAALYELQTTDVELDKLIQLRGELPAEVSALEGEIAALKSKCAHIEEVIDGFNASIENNKQQIVDLDSEIARAQEQLKNISNSREFDAINKDLENENVLRQIAEKNIREARECIEGKRRDLDKLADNIAIREDDLAAKKEELGRIIESTAKEEQVLRARKEALVAGFDERTMSAYERIRSSVRNHLAVEPVYNGDSCGGCFNTITPQRLIDIASGNKLVICEHCGRIIVRSEE